MPGNKDTKMNSAIISLQHLPMQGDTDPQALYNNCNNSGLYKVSWEHGGWGGVGMPMLGKGNQGRLARGDTFELKLEQ